MTEFSEDRVYARHDRRRGAVLIVGVGAVGGFVAEELARIGISPLCLVDPDILEVENLVRHPLGAPFVGQPKVSLAAKIHLEFPVCEAIGIQADFRALPRAEQLRLVNSADIVVAATDNFECQQHINRICLEAEKPGVFPAVWVDPGRLRDAEVGEVLWMLPGRHTPCYECAYAFRQSEADAQAARGARVDIQLLALITAQVVAGLVDPTNERSAVLNNRNRQGHLRTCIYVHGFTPNSPGIREAFPYPGLHNDFILVPFPQVPCPACGGQQPPDPSPPAAPPTSASTVDLTSLREVGLTITQRERAEARERARRESEHQIRIARLTTAQAQLNAISAALRDALLAASPAVKPVVTSTGGVGYYNWELMLGQAKLVMSTLHKIPSTNHFPGRPHFTPGSTEPWSAEADAPFDVIAYAFVRLEGHANPSGYDVRSHALWFCDAQERGRFAWYELAFRELQVPPRFTHSPFGTSPEVAGMITTFQHGAERVMDVARPPTAIAVDDLDDFISRWAGWFADAAQDRLEFPPQLPTFDPRRAWRTDGF